MEPYEGDGLFKDYFLSFSDQKGKKKKKTIISVSSWEERRAVFLF